MSNKLDSDSKREVWHEAQYFGRYFTLLKFLGIDSMLKLDLRFSCSHCIPPFFLQLGRDGCLSHVFSSRRFELNRSGYWMSLDVKATVTEKGTGNPFCC